MTAVELELVLVGSADGVPVEIGGAGSLDRAAGKIDLEMRSARRLLLLDPALVAISLLDLLALAAAHDASAAPDVPVHVRSRTDLFDEHGREAGGWRTVAALERAGGGLRLDGQLLDHVARIEPGERVVAVDAPWAALAQPLEPESVLVAGAWDARTGRGNAYRGVTTTVVDGWAWPVAWTGADAARLAVAVTQIRRTEHDRAGGAVSIAARLAPDLLARPPK